MCVCVCACVCGGGARATVRTVVRVVHQAGTNMGSLCGGGREGYLIEREAQGGKGDDSGAKASVGAQQL